MKRTQRNSSNINDDNNSVMREAKMARKSRPHTVVRRSKRLARPTNARLYTFDDVRDPEPLLAYVLPRAFNNASADTLVYKLYNGQIPEETKDFMKNFLRTVKLDVIAFTRDTMSGSFSKHVAECNVSGGITRLKEKNNATGEMFGFERHPLAHTEFEIHITFKNSTKPYKYRVLNHQVIEEPDACYVLIEIIKSCLEETIEPMRYGFFWYIVRVFFGDDAANNSLRDLLKKVKFADTVKNARTMNNNSNVSAYARLALQLQKSLDNDEKAFDVTADENGQFVPAILQAPPSFNNTIYNNSSDNISNNINNINNVINDNNNNNNKNSGRRNVVDPMTDLFQDMSTMTMKNGQGRNSRATVRGVTNGMANLRFGPNNNNYAPQATVNAAEKMARVNEFYDMLGRLAPRTFGVHYRIVSKR